MGSDFPDFQRRRVRERLGMKYYAGLIGYTPVDVNYKPVIKPSNLSAVTNANLKALSKFLGSCLSTSSGGEDE